MRSTAYRERAREVKATLISLRARHQRTAVDVAAAIAARRRSDQLFGALPKEQIEHVEKQLAKGWGDVRGLATSVALYRAELAARELEAALEADRADAIRPPTNEQALLRRSGQPGLSMETGFLMGILDEQRRARWDRELAVASPADVAALYGRAVTDGDEQAAVSFVAYAESRFAGAWPGAPLSKAQFAEAAALRRLIESTRAARVPAELVDTGAELADLRKIIGKTAELYGVRPVNPETMPGAGDMFTAELSAEREFQAAQQAGQQP